MKKLERQKEGFKNTMKQGQWLINPYKIRKRKSIFRNRFFWLSILISLISGGIFYLIYFSSLFQIKEIQISGSQKIPKAEIENLTQNLIEQKILFFLTKSIFLTDFDKINMEILEKFPKITKVDFERNFTASILTVKIEERKPVAVLITPEEKYFFIDKEGIIFEEADQNIEGFLKIKNLTLNPEADLLNKKVIEKELLLQILEIESKLKNTIKISPEEILIVSDENLTVLTPEGWLIYFNFNKDLNWQLTKLKAVLENSVPLEKRKNLEYIDLRFSDLAPFKYRD